MRTLTDEEKKDADEFFASQMFVSPDISQPPMEVLEKYHLTYNIPRQPFFCGNGVVWAATVEKGDPVYAFFNNGTNNLVILEKKNDKWTQISISNVENLYGIIWKLGAEIELLKFHLLKEK